MGYFRAAPAAKVPSYWYYYRDSNSTRGRAHGKGISMTIVSIRTIAIAMMLTGAPAFAAEQIKVVERPVGETTIDLTAKGDSVGDMLVFANGIFDAANKTQVGTDQGYCVRTIVGKSWECFWTMSLKSGQITIEGPFFDEGDSLMAVTGGTGKYAGAKGSMKLHPRDATPTGYDFTYDLL
jgi:allene oxide cyclase